MYKGHSTTGAEQLRSILKNWCLAEKLSQLIKGIMQVEIRRKYGKERKPYKENCPSIDMIQPWLRITKQKLTQIFTRVSEIMFPPLASSAGIEEGSIRATAFNKLRPRKLRARWLCELRHNQILVEILYGRWNNLASAYTKAEMLRDIEETFRTLRKINMKLNPKKCTFGAIEGMFLGYTITPEGIKPCPNKTELVLQLLSTRTIKEVQSLNEKLASLNTFLSKSAEKSLLLFKTLKKCIKNRDFHWTLEVEQAFLQLKQHLSKLPLLVAPKPKEELIIYLSAFYGAVSTVLMTKRGMVQTPVYFISHALQGPKLKYTPMEKLVLSLVFAAKRLRRAATKVERHARRTQYNIPPKDISERTDTGELPRRKARQKPQDTPVVETPPKPWTIFTDGSSCVDGSGAEDEALIADLQIAAQMGVWNVEVLVKILKEKSIQEEEVATVIEEEETTWMTGITEYLKDGTLPGERKEASKLRIKDRQYELLEGDLYKRSFLKPWIRCVRPLQAKYVIREIHEGSCSMHAGSWTRKGQVFNSRNGLFHNVHRSKSHGNNHVKSESVIPAEIEMPTYCTATVDVVHNDEELWLNLDLLEEKRERASICEAKAKRKMTKYYNVRDRGVTFRPGDFVYRSNDASHVVARGKLGPKWEGPYEVTEAYKLRSMDGAVLPQTWNIANLKKCYL
ncbi:reverse transcriptase domain-containing protein [Tanacetum coccineum]